MKNKAIFQKISRIGILGTFLFTSHFALATPTRVGNGDDGKDLEGGVKIQSGPIWDARLIAIEHLKNLNVPGIAGLGYLIPEVEKTELIMAQEDKTPLQHETGSEVSADQKLVFARTFAEPHAATRFFPSALKLDREQLVALHIHEGLHRSLPEEYREDEELVSAITLSMTSPGANYDRVKRVAGVWMNKPSTVFAATTVPESKMSMFATKAETKIFRPKDEVSYSYQNFGRREDALVQSELHIIGLQKTFFHDSGYQPSVGIRLSADGGSRNEMKMGPVELSAQAYLLNQENFQLAGFISNSFGSAPSAEFNRDVFTLGIKTKYEGVDFLFETNAGYSPASAAKKTGGCEFADEVTCDRTYKGILSLGMRGGYQGTSWLLLGTADLHMAEGWENAANPKGDEFTQQYQSSGRFHLLMVGPEVAWKFKSGHISLFGKEVVASSTKPAAQSMTDLGDIMGRGFSSRTLGLNLVLDL